MQDENQTQIRRELVAEITSLQQMYQTLIGYLRGEKHENAEIIGTFGRFKDGLNLVSARILTFYQLKGQKTKLAWDLLFTNLDTALVTLRSAANPKPQATIQAAFKMSQPPIEEVMEYLAALKQSIR